MGIDYIYPHVIKLNEIKRVYSSNYKPFSAETFDLFLNATRVQWWHFLIICPVLLARNFVKLMLHLKTEMKIKKK